MSAARLEERKKLLALKQRLVGRAFERALERLCALPEEEQIDFLSRLAAAAAPTMGLRRGRSGARLALTGRPEKSLKKWMIQEKVPRHLRGLLPVFACGGQIAAAGGLGPDRAFCPERGAGAWHIALSPAPQAEQTGKE